MNQNNLLEHAKKFINTEAVLPNKSKVKVKNVRQGLDGMVIASFGEHGVINFSLLRDPESGAFLENLTK